MFDFKDRRFYATRSVDAEEDKFADAGNKYNEQMEAKSATLN